MVLMIDPCNSNADLSKIIANAVFLYVITSVPYSESSEPEHFFFQKYFYTNALFHDFYD
jgi:hypothetical protein